MYCYIFYMLFRYYSSMPKGDLVNELNVCKLMTIETCIDKEHTINVRLKVSRIVLNEGECWEAASI